MTDEFTGSTQEGQLEGSYLEAALMALEYANVEPTTENVKRYLKDEILSFTEDERGHYCWYLDNAGGELCFKVETLEEMILCDFS